MARRLLKLLHEIGAAGLLGALAVDIVLLWRMRPATLHEHVQLREALATIADWVILPSLFVVLVSGLLAMAVHRPFTGQRWVWLKAALGIAMFEGTLGALHATASRGADLVRAAAVDGGAAASLAALHRHEWLGLWFILALSLVNVLLAVWRPRLARAGRTTA